MSLPVSHREERYKTTALGADHRTPFQRDRDRILYTSAFRRLSRVSQVVSSAEDEPFHNRLTHTLEVAQIGRRLAEKLLAEQPEKAEAIGGVDPDVVEAAALAHDLGHPPFGHTAEQELDRLIRSNGVADGFEGNPQTFRIVTKLAVRHSDFAGLNLTRATLDAILKYPWHRESDGPELPSKWGAYLSEQQEFEWVRSLKSGDSRKSAEAELMDFADDIAYAIHDVEDFYRAGLIPLDRLARYDGEVDKFLEGAFSSLERKGQCVPYSKNDCKTAFQELLDCFHITAPYTGTREQRARLRSSTAGFIGRYVGAIQLQNSTSADNRLVKIEDQANKELFVFKQLTWYYVINNVALAGQQYGQRKIIRNLFNIFAEEAESVNWDLFPVRYQEFMEQTDTKEEKVRVVADLISSLTEQQAISIYQRLTGISLGTVMDSIVR